MLYIFYLNGTYMPNNSKIILDTLINTFFCELIKLIVKVVLLPDGNTISHYLFSILFKCLEHT